MTTKIYRCTSLLLLALFAFVPMACTNEEFGEGASADKGCCLYISLCEEQFGETRSTPAELEKPLAEQFRLKVQNVQTQRVVYDGPYCDKVEVGNGTYRITASYGDNKLIDIDRPYYIGEAEATLSKKGDNPQVQIVCRVGNALISARYLEPNGEEGTSKFDLMFTGYGLKVSVGDQYVMTSGKQSAYCQDGTSPRVSFYGYLRDTGEKVTMDIPAEKVPDPMHAAQHLILSLKMEQIASGFVVNAEKAEVETVTISRLMPLSWISAPKIGAVPADQLIFETGQASVVTAFPFTTYHLLQDAELTISLEDNEWQSLNGTYQLSTLTDEQRTLLTNAGIVLPALGQTYSHGSLDFSGLAAQLHTNEGQLTRNTISLRVKANDRWSGEDPVSMTLRLAHPLFSLPQQAEGNAWSTSSFIDAIMASDIDGRGVEASEILGMIVYELSTDDGATWQEVSTTTGYAKPQIKGLQPEQSYLLRARLDNSQLVSSNTTTFTTEAQTPVPNGDFEELTEWRKIENLKMGGQYNIWPANYQNTLSVTVSHPNGWETVNNMTCNLDGAANKNTWFCVPSTFNTSCYSRLYQDFGVGASGTTHTKANLYADRQAQKGNTAMVLQNVGWSLNGTTPSRSGGAFNTTYYCTNKPSSISDHSAGELFLKDASGEGNAFASRPTKLKFFYTYTNQKTSGEQGTVEVEVLNGEDVIGSGSAKLGAQSEYTEATVAISYTVIDKKIDRLRIKFKSSDQTTIKTEDVTSWYQCSYGAQLTVDNVTFDYEL